MSEHSQALWDATSQLYEVFTPYRAQTLSVAWQNDLHNFETLASTPLSELSVTDLSPLIENIAAHEDAAQVLRRYMPRIMELCIDGYDRWEISLQTVIGSLTVCNWREWSELEQRSIETFLRALWLHHLNDVLPTGTNSSADTILEAISQVMDIQPFLDVWLDVGNTSATAHIASLAVYGKKRLKDVRRWLSQPNILQRIEAAFWDCGNSDHAAMFAKAAEYLRLHDSPLPA